MNSQVASSSAKLGAQVAARLEQRIRTNGWGAGHYLGHSGQLAQDLGASPAVLREAVAIAEWDGLVESRRGRDGGIYVSAPSGDPGIATLRNYMFLAGADLAGLLRARRQVEGRILELALRRTGPEEARNLAGLLADRGVPADDRSHLSRLKSIVDQLTQLAASPLLHLLGGALRHCFVDRVRTTTSDDRAYLEASRIVAGHRLQQIEAIVAYDRVAAGDLQTRAMDTWDGFVANLRPVPLSGAAIVARLGDRGEEGLIYEFVQPAKKAEAVARAIVQKVHGLGLEPGARIGTEAALCEELGVSRRVLREGLRNLERFGVVEAERGKSGGLVAGVARRELLFAALEAQRRLGPRARRDDAAILGTLLGEAAGRIAGAEAGVRQAFAQILGGPLPPMASAAAVHAPSELAGCLLEVAARELSRSGLAPGNPQRLAEAIRAGDVFAAPRLAAAWVRGR